MIKTYMPNALMRAATDIVKAHPADGGASTVTDQQVGELMKRIQNCPAEEIPSLAYILTRKEIFVLCKCAALEKFSSCLSKIIQIISLRMSPTLYYELFSQWQKYPASRALLQLLADFDAQKDHDMMVAVPVGTFLKWNKAPDVFREIAAFIAKHSGFEFAAKYQEAGFFLNYPLYDRCYSTYLTTCTFAEFIQEGQNQIISCTRKADTVTAEQIMVNLLLCGNAERKTLVKLQDCFDLMFSMWKQPASHRFPKNQDAAFKTYAWWYNYIEMTNSFLLDADPRRKNFWENYLDRCEVVRFKYHRMVIFYFEHYCATEFEDVGRIYIFDRAYFKSTVITYLANFSTQQLKSWMLNSSQYLYEKKHMGRWEPEVASVLRRYI